MQVNTSQGVNGPRPPRRERPKAPQWPTSRLRLFGASLLLRRPVSGRLAAPAFAQLMSPWGCPSVGSMVHGKWFVRPEQPEWRAPRLRNRNSRHREITCQISSSGAFTLSSAKAPPRQRGIRPARAALAKRPGATAGALASSRSGATILKGRPVHGPQNGFRCARGTMATGRNGWLRRAHDAGGVFVSSRSRCTRMNFGRSP
jgi:hypothetical protein